MTAHKGGKVFSRTHRPTLPLRKYSWSSLLLKAVSLKNSNDTIGNRTRGLPACSAVPQPTTPQRAPPATSDFVHVTAVTTPG